MALGFASIKIEGHLITIVKGYGPTIYDEICDEISTCARELKLGCLQYLDGAEDCIFNYSQRQDILTIEIPALRARNLSKHAREVLDGLEYAIKDIKKSREFLLLEGD